MGSFYCLPAELVYQPPPVRLEESGTAHRLKVTMQLSWFIPAAGAAQLIARLLDSTSEAEGILGTDPGDGPSLSCDCFTSKSCTRAIFRAVRPGGPYCVASGGGKNYLLFAGSTRWFRLPVSYFNELWVRFTSNNIVFTNQRYYKMTIDPTQL